MWYWWHTPEPVGVDCPNPLGEVTYTKHTKAPDMFIAMDDAPQIVPHSAPAGRHVYSTAAYTPNTPKPQRGDMFIAGYGRYYLTQGRRESGIRRG